MKIVVCDDLANRGEEIIRRISDAKQDVVIAHCFGRQLTETLNAFFERVDSFLREPKRYKSISDPVFDGADLVCLDNNLAHLDIKGARLTAESIAGYIRAFSGARYIVSLNKNPAVDFDLRYLLGDYATRADLALNTNHLSNRALWTGQPNEAEGGFLPWYWPRLLEVPARRQCQINFVQEHLDKPVFTTLGFPKKAYSFLSPHALGALYPLAKTDGQIEGKPLEQVTLRDVFLARDRSLPAEEDRDILSAAATSKETIAWSAICRVVAADIDLWFRRDALGPQEALVDVPHLIARLPFLLGKRVSDIKAWNEATLANRAPYSLDKALYGKYLAPVEFKESMWVPSPAFWWAELKDNDELNEQFFAAKQEEWPDLVFCEDKSLFVHREPKEEMAPTEFSAEFEGSWGRRYVARMRRIRYAPLSRFEV